MSLIDMNAKDVLNIFKSQYLNYIGSSMNTGSEEEILSSTMTLALTSIIERMNAGALNLSLDTAQGVELDNIASMYGITRETPATRRYIDAAFKTYPGKYITIEEGDLIPVGGTNYTVSEHTEIGGRGVVTVGVTLHSITDTPEPLSLADIQKDLKAWVKADAQRYVSVSVEAQSLQYPEVHAFAYTAEGDNAFREYIKAHRFETLSGTKKAIEQILVNAHPCISSACVATQAESDFIEGYIRAYIRIKPVANAYGYQFKESTLSRAIDCLQDSGAIAIAQKLGFVKVADKTTIQNTLYGLYDKSLSETLIRRFISGITHYYNNTLELGSLVIGSDIIKLLTSTPESNGLTASDLGMTEAAFKDVFNYKLLEASFNYTMYSAQSYKTYPQISLVLRLTGV